MKRLLLFLTISVFSLQFFSCEHDYKGAEPDNQTPAINILETSEGNLTDITSNKKTRVEWYLNDPDGNTATYYYTVTTDTFLNSDNVLNTLALDGVNEEEDKYWKSTEKTYAYVSMPYAPFNSDVYYMVDTTYISSDNNGDAFEENFKAVWSKFFVFGVDENGKASDIQSKVFRRTNRIPKHPMVFSSKLGLNGFDKYWMTVGPDSAQMVLEAQTAFWQPFDFKWMGEDPDGPDVDLEFKWELYERTDSGLLLVTESNGWSMNYLSKSFSREIFNHNRQGKYRFIVRVRDDAFEESVNPATVNFEVFAPEFTKGVLLVDDNDPTLYPPTGNQIMGNPEVEVVTEFYKDLLEYAGFEPAETAADPLGGYTVKRFTSAIDTVRWDYVWDDHDGDPATPEVIVDSTVVLRGYYSPDVRELTKYKLVILASDDRSNAKGIDFAGTPPFTGYNQYLSSLLDVGGNLFIMGPSVLMGKLYTSPNQLPINKYIEPFRQVFDANAPVVSDISMGTKEFFSKYFGIYSMTFPEQKTFITLNLDGTVAAENRQFAQDGGVLADNYDFIGADTYEHITDIMLKNLRVDSTKVNDYWFVKQTVNNTTGAPLPFLNKLSLKDNATVFTGIPTFDSYKGEVVYKYQSIYDLPRDAENDSFTVDTDIDGLKHFLWNKNYVTGETDSPVLKRSGAVATRFIAEGSIFKTAFFGMPTFFLDNSENQVSDMFKAMIDWFDINNDGGSK